MKWIVLIILISIFKLQLMGQMFPLSDQHLNNPLAINPAFAGCQDALSVGLLYRNQWTGFEDSPKNQVFTAHAPIRNDKIGLGFFIGESSFGITRETRIMANYAYRMELNNGKLALGLGFGATINGMAWNDLNATDVDDQRLLNNPKSSVMPDFSIGMYYYTKKYFVGVSVPMLLSRERDQNTDKYRIVNRFSNYNYFLTGGNYFTLNPQIKLLSSFLLKYNQNHSPQLDINAQMIIKERIWFGAGYRTSNTLIGMLQCQLNDQIKLAYSYDFDVSNTGRYKGNSHEVGLNYVFSYSRKVIGPRQF